MSARVRRTQCWLTSPSRRPRAGSLRANPVHMARRQAGRRPQGSIERKVRAACGRAGQPRWRIARDQSRDHRTLQQPASSHSRESSSRRCSAAHSEIVRTSEPEFVPDPLNKMETTMFGSLCSWSSSLVAGAARPRTRVMLGIAAACIGLTTLAPSAHADGRGRGGYHGYSRGHDYHGARGGRWDDRRSFRRDCRPVYYAPPPCPPPRCAPPPCPPPRCAPPPCPPPRCEPPRRRGFSIVIRTPDVIVIGGGRH